ncbi:MAG: HD domain-containing protein [Saprospiraceae bacterium]|nr:HD domain-containing protein [Saprospiraceae bacterium]
MDFEGVKVFILNKLKKELDPSYLYHSLKHTINVYNAVIKIGKYEKVSAHELILLKTAALFHDAGLLKFYQGHEEESSRMVEEILPKFKYSLNDIEHISKLISSTKIPQRPKFQLEKILCDADLDYLGRDDYFETAEKLRKEWINIGLILTDKEWLKIQVKFLQNHKYFTEYSKKNREFKKLEYLKILEKKLMNL